MVLLVEMPMLLLIISNLQHQQKEIILHYQPKVLLMEILITQHLLKFQFQMELFQEMQTLHNQILII